MIRLERDPPRRTARARTACRLDLTTSMYLGDKWEHLFALGPLRLRAYGTEPLAPGRQWLDLPRRDLWIF